MEPHIAEMTERQGTVDARNRAFHRDRATRLFVSERMLAALRAQLTLEAERVQKFNQMLAEPRKHIAVVELPPIMASAEGAETRPTDIRRARAAREAAELANQTQMTVEEKRNQFSIEQQAALRALQQALAVYWTGARKLVPCIGRQPSLNELISIARETIPTL